jgi:hypothetical protein
LGVGGPRFLTFTQNHLQAIHSLKLPILLGFMVLRKNSLLP